MNPLVLSLILMTKRSEASRSDRNIPESLIPGLSKEVIGMIIEGCQGKPQIEIREKTCPRCGHEIEIFSVDTEAVCENCGFVIYNDALTCVQWCQYAKKCVGEEAYEQLLAVARRQKERAAAR